MASLCPPQPSRSPVHNPLPRALCLWALRLGAYLLPDVKFCCVPRVPRAPDKGSYGTLTELLAQMDGISTGPQQVLVIAATNQPTILDPAFLRRMEPHVHVRLPNISERCGVQREQGLHRGIITGGNHLEERLLDQAQARASYTPLFWGHSRSIPQGMILDVQPLVKSLFCPIRPSPNGFFDSEASTP